jgi:hypothetical protein
MAILGTPREATATKEEIKAELEEQGLVQIDVGSNITFVTESVARELEEEYSGASPEQLQALVPALTRIEQEEIELPGKITSTELMTAGFPPIVEEVIVEGIISGVEYLAGEFLETQVDKLLGEGETMGTEIITRNGDIFVDGVGLGGPGIKEPPAGLVSKTWKQRFDSPRGDTMVQYWILIDGRRLTYNYRTGRYKIWRPKKPIVLSRNPRLPQLLKAAKIVDNLFLKVDKRMKKYKSRTRR